MAVRPEQATPIDAGNSTDTVLTSGSVFTGKAVEMTRWASVSVFVFADVASEGDGLSLEQSTDGVNWDRTRKFTVDASSSATFGVDLISQYFRVVYTNGSSNQTAFRLQTIFHPTRQASSFSTDPEQYVPVRFSNGKAFNNLTVDGSGAFGEVVTAPISPQIQVDFVYGGHSALLTESTVGTGSVAYVDGLANISSGASVGGAAHINSTRVCRYRPGQGALYRWTAVYSTPVVGISQTSGMYSGRDSVTNFAGSEDAILVGYNHADGNFGWLRRHNGKKTIVTVNVTAAATGAETATVTLDGTAFPVAVTAGSVQFNAQELSEASYAGWLVEASDDDANFVANDTDVRGGVYSISSTGTLAGTVTVVVAGADATNDWVYQSDWNVDRFDGTGPSGATLDKTKGNVYQVSLQYLGFGAINCMIEDPETGRFQIAHRFEYANTSTLPSLSNSALHMGLSVENVSAGTDTAVGCASLAGFVEGSKRVLGPSHGRSSEGSVTTIKPVLSIRNNAVFLNGVDRVNLREVVPGIVGVSGSGTNKPIRVSFVLNGALTDPLWVDHIPNDSIVAYDESATAVTGGDIILATSFSSGNKDVRDLSGLDLQLQPGDIISVVVEPTGNPADYVASISWKEDI